MKDLLAVVTLGGGVLIVVLAGLFVRALLRFAHEHTDEYGGPVSRKADWFEDR